MHLRSNFDAQILLEIHVRQRHERAVQVMRIVNELQARGCRTWFGAHDDLRSLGLW